MTYPDPDPHPSGPWGPRAWVPFMRDARAAGFDYQKICDHVWALRNRYWRVVIDGRPGAGVELSLHRRGTQGADHHAMTLHPECVGDVQNVLSLLGVLPEMEKAA